MSDLEITRKDISESSVELTIKVGAAELAEIKKHTLELLQPEVDAPGFRKGKAPLAVVEKNLKSDYVQAKFMDEALSHTYREAISKEKLRVLEQPKINVTAFVPYTQLEYNVELSTIPPVKLGDYKKIRKKLDVEKVTASDIDKVIDSLRGRLAETKPVKRAAKKDDEVVIDFQGTDAKGKDVAGAKGADYPLTLGSNRFIPGFEEEVEGLKAGEDKEFEITFPKDYAHKPLAGAKVTFKVTVKEVKEVTLPKADDDFAKKAGPFDDLKALKKDIEAQIQQEKTNEATTKLKDDIIGELVKTSKLSVPQILIDDQINVIKEDFTRNLTYRGITLPEYLEQNNLSEEDFIKKEVTPKAENRVKASLVISEVAEQENFTVSPEELDIRIQLLKGQNQSQAAEFDNPEVRRDIASRMLTEKTVDTLVEYATGKK